MSREAAPSNKASDLNTAISWLISRPLEDVPERIKSHAKELREGVSNGNIKKVYFWYVHNLPESTNVLNELKTVEHSALTSLTPIMADTDNLQIRATEVGINTLEEWYTSISTPILVLEDYQIPITGGFYLESSDWEAYVTSIPASFLFNVFKKEGTKLFSANVRDYLGSRNTDKNINQGIKETASNDPNHFWVYNNGITALVHNFSEEKSSGGITLNISGLSIVNGAQTTGSIGSLESHPSDDALVQVRFIKCKNDSTLKGIVQFNNSQNKLMAPDYRSNDAIQRRLIREFERIPGVQYQPRRGGFEDLIRRRPSLLSSTTVGQALAAFHGNPYVAYNQKTHIWENDKLYSTYFNDSTSAKHIVFTYSLLKSVEKKKKDLIEKSKGNTLTTIESQQLEFFRLRGSIFLFTSAITSSIETILNRQIPDLFSLSFKDDVSPDGGMRYWNQIIEAMGPFSIHLTDGISDGLKNKTKVDQALTLFQSFIASTKESNKEIYSLFTRKLI